MESGKRKVFTRIITSRVLVVACVLSASLNAHAQVAGRSNTTPTPSARPIAVVQPSGKPTPRQVVTVIHRLSGMKVLSLLHRGGQSPMVVGDEFLTAQEMLTSVTAGFALGDGKSIVARLPQAEAEVEFNFTWPTLPTPPAPFTPRPTPVVPTAVAPAVFPRMPELQVIQRDGKLLAARYVGLDAGTGLSLLQLDNLNSTPLRDAAEEQLKTGQRVRLLAPQRTNSATASNTPGQLYLSVGEIEGKIFELKRSASGKLSHLIVRAPTLNSAFAGGIAFNDEGDAIGIVETGNDGEARVMPMAVVRRAAERVLARQGNVPQPWLGIRGQALTSIPLAKLLARGWTQEEAEQLRANRHGIFLTAVVPNTPAALANLRSGDVIVKLNEDLVNSTEDFSFMLNEAGIGATVNFTVLRRSLPKASPAVTQPMPAPPAVKPLEVIKPLVVSVKLSESLNPVRSIREAESKRRSVATDPLSAVGIESIPLTPKAAARLGASGGLLVVFVEQESTAARAGLRVFDIIESVNGQLLSPSNAAFIFKSDNTQPKNITVVRGNQKFNFSFSFAFSTEDKPQQ